MKGVKLPRLGFGWLEGLLALAVVALALQLFPGLLSALDPRTWAGGTWLGVNLAVILALFGVRFWPELRAEWQQRRARKGAKRRRPVVRFEANQQDADYQERAKRDAEWRNRAKQRRPWR